MSIIYRMLKPEECAIAALIEKDCLHTAWSEAQIANLPANACYIGAFDGETLCGIASMYCVLDEGQIMNVAVSPEHRRKGIAFGLMNAITEKAVLNGCTFITLEVAENNISAISLYEKCGFVSVGKRKKFYGNVSALIMEKTL